MKLKLRNITEILRCPKSGSKLELYNDKLVAIEDSANIEYPLINGYPILINYENSILKEEDYKELYSKVERPSYIGLLKFLKRIASPSKSSTAKNVKQIIELICQGQQTARVLIIGGGTIGQGMKPFYDNPDINLVSFDIYASPNVQFIADAHNIPLSTNSFDAVIIQAVLEHVLEPSTVVSEIYRVLKFDGIVYSETPFIQHVHEGAYDFTRFTESGHRYLFKYFELIKSGASAGAGSQLIWSIDNFF